MKATLYDLNPGPDTPEVIRMIVEIPKHSTNKYEYDKELGVFGRIVLCILPYTIRAIMASFQVL